MKELNDFETNTVLSVPLYVGSVIKAVRCILCDHVYFANYRGNDYECMSCRKTE